MKTPFLTLIVLILTVLTQLKAETLNNDVYNIEAIDRLYPINPDLALVRLDSLRHRCELEGYKDVTRQRLDIIQSCAHFNKNEIRLGLYFAGEALKHARKAGDMGIELLSLQMLCNGYDLQGDDRLLSYYAGQLLALVPNAGKKGNWYESVALCYLAGSAIKSGDKEEGIRLLYEALDKLKKDKWNGQLMTQEVICKLAKLYSGEGNYEKAYSLLDIQLKELENSSQDTHGMDLTGLRMSQMECRSLLMNISHLMGREDEAFRHYRKVRDLYNIYPTLPETPLLLSRFLLETNQNKEAEAFLNTLIQKQRESADTLNDFSLQYIRLLAQLMTRQERFKEANRLNVAALNIADTLKRRSKQHTMLELNAMYKVTDREQVIAGQLHTIHYQRIGFIVLLVAVLIMAALLFHYNRYKRDYRRKKKKIKPVSVASTVSPPLAVSESVSPQPIEDNEQDTGLVYATIMQFVVKEKHFLHKGLDITEVGKQCHINKELINKVLIQKENRMLQDLINIHRLEYACSLLSDETNKTVDVIADESGFNTTRTFLRQFKSRYDMSPSEYRRGNHSL